MAPHQRDDATPSHPPPRHLFGCAQAAIEELAAACRTTGLRPTAEVVAIVDDSGRAEEFSGCLGLLPNAGGARLPKMVYFKPFNKKVPRFFLVPFQELPDGREDFALDETLWGDRIFMANVLSWRASDRNPRGKLTSFEGRVGDIIRNASLKVVWVDRWAYLKMRYVTGRRHRGRDGRAAAREQDLRRAVRGGRDGLPAGHPVGRPSG